MNLVEVKRISYYPPSKGYAVLLVEKDGDRSIRIMVGQAEAQAIALYLEKVDLPRPMTHDLIINLLETTDTEINHISIARMENGTFFAEIEVSNVQIGELKLDSRPSDAIALALRSSTAIYVSDEVMNKASENIDVNENREVPQHITSEEMVNEPSEESMLENLNDALEKAISEEEYEVAARLRDRIKQLEKKSS